MAGSSPAMTERRSSSTSSNTGEHAIAVGHLPPLHKDPFDRLLIAQSAVEGITLLTSDPLVAQYPGPVRRV
jgi:PIN domain nuclease of toxin-antitoxin system